MTTTYLAWTAEDVLVRVSVLTACLVLITAAVRVAVTGFRRLDQLQDQQSWVRQQMESPTPDDHDPSIRQLVEVTADRTSNLTKIAVVNEERLERIEQNQQRQGQQLAPMATELAALKAIVERHEIVLHRLESDNTNKE